MRVQKGVSARPDALGSLSAGAATQAGIRTSLNYANMLMALALRAWQVPASVISLGTSVEIRTRNGLSPKRLEFLN